MIERVMTRHWAWQQVRETIRMAIMHKLIWLYYICQLKSLRLTCESLWSASPELGDSRHWRVWKLGARWKPKQLHLNICVIRGASTHLPVKVNTNIRLHVLRAVAENLKIINIYPVFFLSKDKRSQKQRLVPSIMVIHDNEALLRYVHVASSHSF